MNSRKMTDDEAAFWRATYTIALGVASRDIRYGGSATDGVRANDYAASTADAAVTALRERT